MADMRSPSADTPAQASAHPFGQMLFFLPAEGDHRGSADSKAVPGATPLGGALKRGLDLVVAAGSTLAFAPIGLLLALLILATMGRPVFIYHPRVGFQHKMFGCYKFRSMVRDGDAVLQRHLAANSDAAREWSETQKLRDDPRVTFVGRMLRKSSLDELPQLINVLRGEMSCVGPRPIVEDELPRYGAKAPLYLSTRPGMTGLWQVSGRSSVDYARRVDLDENYVRSWSLWLDLKILFRTVGVLIDVNDAA
jgi:exopolysaccharide production protein ExoY